MRKLLAVLLLVGGCGLVNAITWKAKGAVPAPAKFESFENGVPKTWSLQGRGKLSISPWHYKLGKKSLQWDFKSGDKIKINNTIGDPARRGGRNNIDFACFGIWVYVKTPMSGKNLRFEFCTDDKRDAYFDYPLNYKGWQCGYVMYKSNRYLKGKVSTKTNNILIKPPAGADGQLFIDLVVYNGPRYSMFANILPNKTPWVAPTVDTKKYPLPEKVSERDLKAIARIKNELLTRINITDKGKGTANYNEAMQVINKLNIVEDSHGIRGNPLNVSRDHGGCQDTFYTYNGIPRDQLDWYNDAIVHGDRRNRWTRGVSCKTSRAAALGISKAQHETLSKACVKLWKFLLDQGFNTSYGYNNYYSGTCEKTAAGLYVVRDALFASGIMPEVFQYAQYKNYPLFTTGDHIRSMDNFGSSGSLFYLAFLYSQDVKKQVQALRALRDRLNTDITGDYGPCGFKPDGCGYHYTGFSVDYMQGGIKGICEVARVLSNSSFSLSDEAFNVLKKVVLRAYFYTSNSDVPIFMQGTSPLVKNYPAKFKFNHLPGALRNLALAGKGGCDKELAQAYVNIKAAMKHPTVAYYGKYDDVFEKKYGIKPSKLPSGNISMPYGPLVAQRRNDWVAIAWGGGIDMRGRGNHYMYHGGNAPLSIMGKDGFHAAGTEEYGWDWNRTNGTTCLYMPELTSIKYIHMGRKPPKGNEGIKKLMRWRGRSSKNRRIIKRGNGGISWRGVNGCFRKIFRGDKFYNDFSGIKSYFFIGDRIYALGSNISSDNKKYHVQTNLYQKALFTTKEAKPRVWKKVEQKDTPTFVDGAKITAFPVPDKALSSAKAHHLIDPQGNGYFVPKGQKAFTARKEQKSRIFSQRKFSDSTGDYATAWLDHGIACKDAKYVYVVMPYCDKAKFVKLTAKDFAILRQDEFAHILHDKIDGFYAGIFFKGGKVDKLPHVLNVERDCQIMYKEDKNSLEVALGDPDPHRNWTNAKNIFGGSYGGPSTLTPLKVTFAGAWKLAKDVDGVKILSSDKNKTVIEFACIHGRTFDFTLKK